MSQITHNLNRDAKKLEELKLAGAALRRAGEEMRTAWTMLKRNGMDTTAKELADTILDVETSANQLHDFFEMMTQNMKVDCSSVLRFENVMDTLCAIQHGCALGNQ